MKLAQSNKLNVAKEMVIDLPSQPEESEMVLRLLSRYQARREDDTPEEGANRLAAMALMLSNFAAAHRVASADGVEADLGVRLVVEGEFLPSDISQSVFDPAFRFQKSWERSLLHDVNGHSSRRHRDKDPLTPSSREFHDRMNMPGPRLRETLTQMQKGHVLAEQEKEESRKEQDLRAAQANGESARLDQQCTAIQRQNAPAQNTQSPNNPYSGVPKINIVEAILGKREDTYFREAMDYRVFIADATSPVGLENRVTQAHLGRFVMHASIASCEAFDRMGKIMEEFSHHRNIRRGDATMTLLADPVILLPTSVLNDAAARGIHSRNGFNRWLWLVESAAGYDLPDRAEVKEETTQTVLDFRVACEKEISHRINFKNNQTHEQIALKGHMARWRTFLREQERHHPGIAGVAKNLPFALCYGLEALCDHQSKAVGEEVIALAKWLVMRMINRLATLSSAGQRSRIERLATKLANKLLTNGPMTVRNLTRSVSRMKSGECQQALEWLASRQIAAQKDNKWGILGDAVAVRAFVAANAG